MSFSSWAGNRTPTRTKHRLDRVCVRDSEEYQYLTIFKNKRYVYIYIRNRETDGYLQDIAANSKNSKKLNTSSAEPLEEGRGKVRNKLV